MINLDSQLHAHEPLRITVKRHAGSTAIQFHAKGAAAWAADLSVHLYANVPGEIAAWERLAADLAALDVPAVEDAA